MTNLLERQAKKAGDELEQQPNWRQIIFCLYWDTLYVTCPHCGMEQDCLLRVARLSNGFEARDLACVYCRRGSHGVMEQGILMYSPQDLAEERRLEQHMGAHQAREHTIQARIAAIKGTSCEALPPSAISLVVPRYLPPPHEWAPPPQPSLWRRLLNWLTGQ